MSQQFGNPGRKPGRPGGQPSGGSSWRGSGSSDKFQNRQPNLREDEEDDGIASLTPRTGSSSVERGTTAGVAPERIEFGKRIVALMFDSLACYLIAMVLTVVPFVKMFVTLNGTWVLLMLVRDYFFDGRGIGKNLMGLQVVDAATGSPCSLKQSVIRNIVILAPFAVLQVVSALLAFIPHVGFNEAVKTLVNIAGMVYVAVVLPMEGYRAYTREDSLRYGDQFAGTVLVESSMDFSNALSK